MAGLWMDSMMASEGEKIITGICIGLPLGTSLVFAAVLITAPPSQKEAPYKPILYLEVPTKPNISTSGYVYPMRTFQVPVEPYKEGHKDGIALPPLNYHLYSTPNANSRMGFIPSPYPFSSGNRDSRTLRERKETEKEDEKVNTVSTPSTLSLLALVLPFLWRRK